MITTPEPVKSGKMEETVDVNYLRKFQSIIVQYQAVLDDCMFVGIKKANSQQEKRWNAG